MGTKRVDSDEYYVLDICDEILGKKGMHQYGFPFLLSDAGTPLKVDIFYPDINLVIEYREKQHYKDVPFFDKPDKLTASGVPRNIQRKIYDKRREDILPLHGIDVVIIPYYELDSHSNGKLKRNLKSDRHHITKLLSKYL